MKEKMPGKLSFCDTVPETFLKAHQEGSLCFLLGAVASSAYGLPDARCLTRAILDQLLLLARPHLSIAESVELDDFLSSDDVNRIRLEVLLGAIESQDVSGVPIGGNHYISAVARMISSGAIPHPLHRLLYDGLQSGQIPAVFTTNWDCLVESAGPALATNAIAWDEASFKARQATASSQGLLAKLHGTSSRDDDDPAMCRRKAQSLIFDLLGLGGPLAPNARHVFESYLKRFPVLVLGYGGYDPDIHISLREAHGPICWVVHPDEVRGRRDGERIAQYLPNVADNSVFVFGLEFALKQMFAIDFRAAPEPPSLFGLFDDIRGTRALVAVGLALEHARQGQAASRVFEIAANSQEGQQDAAVQYHRWTHFSRMYGGVLSVGHLETMLQNTDLNCDTIRYFELAHFYEIAIENFLGGSWLRLLNAWCGRPQAARFLREYVDFAKLTEIVKEMDPHTSPQEYARAVAALVNLCLSSVRVWKTESLEEKRTRLNGLIPYANQCRAFGLQGDILRYLGRLSGMMDSKGLADDFYRQAEERFAAISDHVGLSEVKKYRFKTELSYGNVNSNAIQSLAQEYFESRGVRLPYVRFVHWASMAEHRIPIIGPHLSKWMLHCLRKHLGSLAGF